MYDNRTTCISGAQAHDRLTEIGYVQNLDGIMSRQYSKEYPDGLVVTALVIIHAAGRLIADATLEPAVVHYRITAYPKI